MGKGLLAAKLRGGCKDQGLIVGFEIAWGYRARAQLRDRACAIHKAYDGRLMENVLIVSGKEKYPIPVSGPPRVNPNCCC